jgi:hypothetical protein
MQIAYTAFKNTPKQQHLNFDERSRARQKKRRNLHAWHAADIQGTDPTEDKTAKRRSPSTSAIHIPAHI